MTVQVKKIKRAALVKVAVFFLPFLGSVSWVHADELYPLRTPPDQRARGESMLIAVPCRANEYAEISDPIPTGDHEFRAAVDCKPARCRYQKQGEFPWSVFTNVWHVVRDSGTKVSVSGGGGFQVAPGRVLQSNIQGRAAAAAAAQRFVAEGVCVSVSYALPDASEL